MLGVVAEREEAGAVDERRGVEVVDDRDVERAVGRLDDVREVRVAVLGQHGLQPRREPIEEGQERVGVPALGAEGHPLLEIARERLERDHRVVRRAAAEDPGPRVADLRVAPRLRDAAVVEVVLALEHLEPAPQLERARLLAVGRPRLDQADRH